ncbi:MAG: NAD(P)-binding domain-containing protein [Flavobacterium sp.]|nr:NAD(P)-binding domain-containing protein [Pedobacter sp.]
MALKQTVAIIGATGNMGSVIAKSLANGPYRLLLMAKDTVKLQQLYEDVHAIANEVEQEIIACPKDACWEADLIIFAVPYSAEAEIAEKIKQYTTGKVVVSISNPMDKTFSKLLTSSCKSAAEELQDRLPYSKVIKAFNTTFAANFEHPVIDGKQVDAFIAGDDEEALGIVSNLVKTVGFNPIIAGDLSVSRILESMQLLLVQLGLRYNYNWLAGWKVLHK